MKEKNVRLLSFRKRIILNICGHGDHTHYPREFIQELNQFFIRKKDAGFVLEC